MVFSLTALLLGLMACSSQASRITLETARGPISEDVVSDPTGQTLLVTVGQGSIADNFISTVNLHDLTTGWAALRRDEARVCLLKPSTNAGAPKSSVMRPVTYHWGVKPGALTHEGIGQLAGEKLADFCSDYKTYVLVPKPASPASEDGQRRRYKRRINVCFLCVNCCNKALAMDLDEIVDIDTEYLM